MRDTRIVQPTAPQHYRAYQPKPVYKQDIDQLEVLFGGLHWRAERLIQATLENRGYKARVLPQANKADLLLGRELADIGQCCPTSFTTGNLANFLRKEVDKSGPENVASKFAYITAGSCGACRFGQYHQSYELALRGLGLEDFRLFLIEQNRMDQGALNGGGLEFNMPLTLGAVWAVLCTDVLQSLEYQIRPYEVEKGATQRAVERSVDYLYEVFKKRPYRGKKWSNLVWHLSTNYFVNALREVKKNFELIEVDRLQCRPVVKITGEFYLQTVEGDPNYNIHSWLESEGAEVYPAPIAVWLDYWMRFYVQIFEDYRGIDRLAGAKIATVKTLQRAFRWTYNRLRAALGNIPHELPDQYELRRLAAPYYHHRLSGGEGDMLVGKALWAHLNKKAHMICELSPYACMPNTMSVGAMAAVLGQHPDLLYAPIEVKGDAEVHALSRCQMILTEAKKRAVREYVAAMEKTGLTPDDAKKLLDARPYLKQATYRLPRDGAVGVAANLLLHLAQLNPCVEGRVKIVGMDVGSTTVKAVVVEDDRILWRDYQRHGTRQAEKVFAFLDRMHDDCGLEAGEARIFFTGSGAGLIAPLVGGKVVQEVVAVAAAVEKLHPDVNFVSEIGGEDMKTIFLNTSGNGKSKQVYMQSACSGGTGTFIEKTARKLQINAEDLCTMPYDGMSLHKISSKCGIFAETDANTLLKSGVPADEIIASLFEAVVYQNLATLTKGNTPLPNVLLLGGPNLFFRGLQQAWRHHLARLWSERNVRLSEGGESAGCIKVPDDALYYAALGCIEVGKGEAEDIAFYQGTDRLRWWIEDGQHREKLKASGGALITNQADREQFNGRYGNGHGFGAPVTVAATSKSLADPLFVGCDFGSTTAKAIVLSAEKELLYTAYVPSNGNPISDAQALFRDLRAGGVERIAALALTGYGKDLLIGILGADLGVVETVAHARSALHIFPDADVICDVGGTDVKIMMLRHGTVADFRLNSQCSSGNGAFLQGVAERYGIALEDYAARAFEAKAMPELAMGCGVFLQSDIVNQQRKGWSAEEIMAGLASVLPLNVWIYAGQLQNLRAAGRRFVLQGGTHRNLAVVKAQVNFITSRVPDAEILIHPYSGEAGAIGAALYALDAYEPGCPSRFRGYEAIEALEFRTTTGANTVCRWCPVNCKRAFIDVRSSGAKGRPWSKIPLEEGWERVISGNSCPKGLLEDVNEMKVVKAEMEKRRRAYPNIGEMVRESAFGRAWGRAAGDPRRARQA